MTHEGPPIDPAHHGIDLSVESTQNDTQSQLRTFLIHARNLDAHRYSEYFAMSPQYKRRIERKFWQEKKDFGVTARRGTQEYRDEMAELEKQSELPQYFSQSEPEPIDTTGEEVTFYYRYPEESENPEMLNP